jgi:hypothetical protein
MPTLQLGPARAPTWTRPPDGMLPQDWDTWFSFQKAHAAEYQSFHFNVHLPPIAPHELPNQDDMLLRLSALLDRRVDCIAVRHDGTPEIIEVSTAPSPSVLGRLLIYGALWQHHTESDRVILRLVARTVSPDLELAAQTADIAVTIVPA